MIHVEGRSNTDHGSCGAQHHSDTHRKSKCSRPNKCKKRCVCSYAEMDIGKIGLLVEEFYMENTSSGVEVSPHLNATGKIIISLTCC